MLRAGELSEVRLSDERVATWIRSVTTNAGALLGFRHAQRIVDATYGARGIPYLCLVDGEGKILAVGDGCGVIDEVERLLGERLGAKPQ